MWLTLVMVLSVSAQDNKDAEQLFRQMEAKLSKAKALDLSFDITIEGGAKLKLSGWIWNRAICITKGAKLQGTLAAMSGNKVRLEMNGGNFVTGEPFRMLMVSDGTRMRRTGEPGEKPRHTPKDLDLEIRTWVARPGVFLPQGPLPDVAVADAKDRYRVSGFKLGNKEKAGEREAQRLDYQLSVKGQDLPFSVTVWIDLKTGLPVKRLVTSGVGEEKIAVSENYGKLTLDEKVDPKNFDLPK